MSQEIVYWSWLVNTLYAGRCFEIASLCLHYLFETGEKDRWSVIVLPEDLLLSVSLLAFAATFEW
jgi:hypothetical protein